MHSAIYVRNGTDRKLGFRLHYPDPWLAAQVALSPGDTRIDGQDILMKTLSAGEG